MSQQSEALLGLVGAYYDTPEAERTKRQGQLWANPVICTPEVYAMAEAEAEPAELTKLQRMVELDLIVVSAEPAAKRAELANLRPGYINRSMRRAAKRGKHK